eukprot:Cvel_21299.t1-p1 / transcript=Cvel_21299.t1 / gene=Cvel_21299 / organism=Chromera_velia_CCMP2878 / gene_product=ER lumen protein retaining receptor, putative / transcript_product=ER lumen protein retaining receptor, putative / location=Cvel_scaffold1984:32211-35687(+) / protein_length=228 / sequence_SO=supercontig / SO=protein_coding / is_pseudo=false
MSMNAFCTTCNDLRLPILLVSSLVGFLYMRLSGGPESHDNLPTFWAFLGEYVHFCSYLILFELIFFRNRETPERPANSQQQQQQQQTQPGVEVKRSIRGLSVQSLALMALTFITRYLDLFLLTNGIWFKFLKSFYIASSVLSCAVSWCLRETYEASKDTAAWWFLLAVSVVFGLVFNGLDFSQFPPKYGQYTFRGVLWTFSQAMQGFAMLPQFIFCYRDPNNKNKSAM